MIDQPKVGFVDVDALQQQVSVQQVAAFYRYRLSDSFGASGEQRLACFNTECPGQSDDRAMSINLDDPAKRFKCHKSGYGCGARGNLLVLMYGMKHGRMPPGDRLTGGAFNEIKADLVVIAGGKPALEPPSASVAGTKPASTTDDAPEANVPLSQSPNESVRALATLDEKLVTEVAQMNPAASKYFRARPFLSPEVCQKWRMGYMPSDGGRDRRGTSLRGNIVYPMLSVDGDVLCWFGRDPKFEEKHEVWSRSDRSKPEPMKHRFPKGFHRSLELFGQQGSRLDEHCYRDRIRELGVIVVEGPNDVIRLDTLGIPAVAVCSNSVSDSQIEKIAPWARRLGGNRVTLMLDADRGGEEGAAKAMFRIAEQMVDVRLAWSRTMFGGRFDNHQPESLDREEWGVIAEALAR